MIRRIVMALVAAAAIAVPVLSSVSPAAASPAHVTAMAHALVPGHPGQVQAPASPQHSQAATVALRAAAPVTGELQLTARHTSTSHA
jgi:hypothetical protein